MTSKQIQQEINDLHDGEGMCKFYQAGKKLSPAKQKRYYELKCMDMIDSILCYQWTNCPFYTAKEVLDQELGSYYSYLKEYVDKLGKERVLELIQGQMDSIAGVRVGVFTDSEGCTYNSIIYKEV